MHSLNLYLRFSAGAGPLLFSGKSLVPFALAIPHDTATVVIIRNDFFMLELPTWQPQEARTSLTSNSVGALGDQEKNTWQPNLHSALSGSREGIPESYLTPTLSCTFAGPRSQPWKTLAANLASLQLHK